MKFTVEVKYCTSVACVEKPTPDKPVGNMSVNLTSFITLFFADNIDSVASDKVAPTFTAVPSLPANLLTPDSSLPCVGNLSLPASTKFAYSVWSAGKPRLLNQVYISSKLSNFHLLKMLMTNHQTLI